MTGFSSMFYKCSTNLLTYVILIIHSECIINCITNYIIVVFFDDTTLALYTLYVYFKYVDIYIPILNLPLIVLFCYHL